MGSKTVRDADAVRAAEAPEQFGPEYKRAQMVALTAQRYLSSAMRNCEVTASIEKGGPAGWRILLKAESGGHNAVVDLRPEMWGIEQIHSEVIYILTARLGRVYFLEDEYRTDRGL